MLTDQEILELRSVLVTQADLLRRVQGSVCYAETQLAGGDTMAAQLAELDALMSQLEAEAALLPPDALDDFDPEAIPAAYAARRKLVEQEWEQIGCNDWDRFVRECQRYALQHGLDPLQPYEALLAEPDLRRLREESYDAQFRWDGWDYAAVGISGLLAVLTDLLLVKTPGKSPITSRLKQYDIHDPARNDWFARTARQFEKTAQTPYDAMQYEQADVMQGIGGMGGRSHRFQSLGHDPVLGFIFGIRDILRGTITAFDYDQATGTHRLIRGAVSCPVEPVELTTAILLHLCHLLSDVATPMGLPAPFMTALQAFNSGDFGAKHRTMGEVARRMYLGGYDLRHTLVTGITPGVIELILRGYLMLRRWREHGDLRWPDDSDPKVRSMLLMAHAIAALGNAGKIAVTQSPLAFNYAEWAALVRYLIPSLKYWLFERDRLRLEHLSRINRAGWDELLQNGSRIIQLTAADLSELRLGSLSA